MSRFPALKPDKLRFYLDGESGLVNILYEVLFSRLNRIMVRDLTPGIAAGPCKSAGLRSQRSGIRRRRGDDSLCARFLRWSSAADGVLRLPGKVFFHRPGGIECIAQAGFKDAIEVIFLISQMSKASGRTQRLELELSKKTFRLGCTPVVNLFPQTAEPIQLESAEV